MREEFIFKINGKKGVFKSDKLFEMYKRFPKKDVQMIDCRTNYRSMLPLVEAVKKFR